MKYSVELMILRKAIQVANNCAMDFKPNLILAQGYGAKVALKMNKPRIPLVAKLYNIDSHVSNGA